MGNCFRRHAAADVIPVAYSSTGVTASITSDTATSDNGSVSTFTSQSFFSAGSTAQQQRSGEVSRQFCIADSALHRFTYADLRTATKNFTSSGRLGEGGFGTVYKGYIDDKTFAPAKPGKGMTVAIKKLNLGGFQGHREWVTEILFLGALRHPNLVRLIGFCQEDSNRLLVYEYMSRGSLENHLFNKWRGSGCLSWEIRTKVALDTARGLKFLHDSETHVIYRDFKAANILLDDNYNAKLSDFGLAKYGPSGNDTHVSTRVMGTYGYAAPEYLATGHLSSRSDVYSFGVVLLELMTGRAAMDPTRPQREQKLVEWAKPYLHSKKRMLQIMDPGLERQFLVREAQKMINLAVRCLNEDAKSRPTMKEVVEILCEKDNTRRQ